jgi:nucleoside phosphorylase
MPSLSADDLPRYRRAFDRAIHAWHLLAAHVWVRLTATLRQAHNVELSDQRYTDDPDLARSFPEACAFFLDALGQLKEFDEASSDFVWLRCGEQTLTSSDPPPDLEHWLDSIKGIDPAEWQQSAVDPFQACAGAVSRQFQVFSERFEQVKESVIVASDNRAKTRLQVSQALQNLQAEQQGRQEEQSQRRKRLWDLLTAAVNSTPLTNEPTEEWARRLVGQLVAVGEAIREQQWKEWLKATAEGEPLAEDFAELMLEGDQDRITQAVEQLPNVPTDLGRLHEWLKVLLREWPKVFDQGWLRWMHQRPPQTDVQRAKEDIPSPGIANVSLDLEAMKAEWASQAQDLAARRRGAADYYVFLRKLWDLRGDFQAVLPNYNQNELPANLVGPDRCNIVVGAFLRFLEAVKGVSDAGRKGADRVRRVCQPDPEKASRATRLARQFFRWADAGNRQDLVNMVEALGEAPPLEQFDVWLQVKYIADEIVSALDLREMQLILSGLDAWSLVPEELRPREQTPRSPATAPAPPHPPAVVPSTLPTSSGPLVEIEKKPMSSTVKPPVDFLIVTALEEERDAVLLQLPGYTTPPPSTDDVRYYYTAAVDATFSDGTACMYNVALVSLANMGRVQAATTASDAIRMWRPRYVMLIGIAGGLRSSKVGLGDILIADQIVDYELQKMTKDGAEIRWHVHQVDPRLLEFALNFPADKWQELVSKERPKEGEPARHKGPVATGDKVITVSNLLESYKKQNWPKLIGVEMEGGGVALAAHQSAIRPGFFMVRCVSDLLDNKNQKKVEVWRAYACDVAACYALAMIRNGPVPPASPHQGAEVFV